MTRYGPRQDTRLLGSSLTLKAGTFRPHLHQSLQEAFPWLSLTEVGEIYSVPISHGEGRFLASEELLRQLAANGQIATQYVDLNGEATNDVHFNPNNSLCAVEGITSPDGRVFGKMGHAERVGRDLYKNVPGNYNIRMFEAAVDGRYNFVKELRNDGLRAHHSRKIFDANGFHLVYDKDIEQTISDGFFYTVSYQNLTNGELLSALLRCGVIAIPLNTTGSGQSGIRVCVSRLLTDEDFQLLDDHLKLFVRLVNGEV